MSESVELLPCPHCGGEAYRFETSDTQAMAIYCSNCPLGLEDDDASMEELEGIWNELPRYEE